MAYHTHLNKFFSNRQCAVRMRKLHKEYKSLEAAMTSLEKIADQVGFLVMSDSGDIVTSGGELDNDQNMAKLILQLINTIDLSKLALDENGTCQRMTVNYPNHSLVICLSNGRINVVKRRVPILDSVNA